MQEYKQWRNRFMAKFPQLSVGKVAMAMSILIFTFLFLIFVAYHLAYWERIYPGVAIAGQAVGNLTPAEAEAMIKTPESQITATFFLNLKSGEQEWPLNLTELNFSYDFSKTTQRAYQIGRSGNFQEDFSTKIEAWSKGINLGMAYSLDQALLESQIATIAAQIYIPTIEPSIKIAAQKIEIEPGKDGQELDRRRLLAVVNHQLSTINFTPIEIPVIYLSPTLTPEQTETTRQRAEKLLGKKLVLVNEEMQWQLEEEELIQLLSFTNGFDQDKIASWSANLATAINRLPENAAFQFSKGRVTEFRPAKEGKFLDQEKTIRLITDGLTQLETLPEEASAEAKIISLSLPVILTSPLVKTAEVNSLGIKQSIGQGVSYFRGSIASRIHNIQLASSKLNGLLIAPGEIFSFNKALGEVSKTTGYQEAYIIKEGRTVLGDGGGVCQVSTTLFRAALNAGLPITERQAHAYRVSYYEQNSAVGLDATVFEPTADLKFKNDTSAHILIQTGVDSTNKKLTFDLYGSSDGRTVTISKSRIWDQVPPPPDLYQDDPTLSAGTIKQIDWKAWGAKVAFDWKVVRNNEVLQERTFYSAYHPWQAVFLRGIGPAQ